MTVASEPRRPGAGDAGWPARAAVVGAGYMGTGFVQLLALAGGPCAIGESSAEASEAARARAIQLATAYEQAGLMARGAGERVAELTVAAPSIAEAVASADVILEAVPEDPSLKATVLAAIEAAAPASAVIATNTSAIPIADLADGLRRPERFLGAHWFNPSQWVPCVEVIPGPATDPRHVGAICALLERLGKRPAVVGDGPGFVANRIQFAMFKEAAAIVEEGLAPAGVVDDVVRTSFGYRLPFFGPFEIADMAGLDVYAGAYASLERGLGERLAAPAALTEQIEAGRLGAKTGGGFLDLDAEAAEAMARWRDGAYRQLETLLGELGSWERA